MIIISYDIANDKIRARFARMLTKIGAIRLQFSVYELRNTNRITDNAKTKIEAFAKHFTPDDSVVIFEVEPNKLIKYGNTIHRDKSIVFF